MLEFLSWDIGVRYDVKCHLLLEIIIMHVLVRKIKYCSTILKKVIWSRAVWVLTVARVYGFTGTGP